MSERSPSQVLGPVEEAGRIQAIDAARGLALLGIFCVNIQFFAAPFGSIFEVTPQAGEGVLGRVAFFFEKIFCEGKFYTLFSTLFGVGLVLQMNRADDARRRFGPVYLRRLGILALIGLVHGLLLWYGDILFIYSIAGAILLLFSRLSTRALVIAGIVVMSFAMVLTEGMTALMVASRPAEAQADHPADGGKAHEAGAPQPVLDTGAAATTKPETTASSSESPSGAQAPEAPTAPPAQAPSAKPPFERFIEGFKDNSIMKEAGDKNIPPFSTSTWISAETDAYRNGPYLQALGFRVTTFLVMLIFVCIGFGWTVLAMFFFGAAMAKADIFAPERLGWHRRMAVLGAAVGLPMAAGATFLATVADKHPLAMLAATPMSILGAPLVALGYLGFIRLLTASGRARVLTGALAALGRMALTNYLLQTVVATFIFYHWGLGHFGEVGHAGRIGIVLAIYLVQAALSVWWLGHFRFGPMEWLWRTMTYMKPQPMLRRRAS